MIMLMKLKKETSDSSVTDEEKKVATDPALLKSQFVLFSKFGDKTADGKTIKLSQSDKWFKQARVIQAKGVSTTDTGITFRKEAKSSTKLSYRAWCQYLEELAGYKNIEAEQVKEKLANCGPPE